MDLRKELIKVFEDRFTVSQYKRYEKWVMSHIDRICYGYNGKTWEWLKVGGKIFFKSHGFINEAKFEGFIITTDYVGFRTNYGNIWYHEGFKTKKDAENYKEIIYDF